MCDAVGVQYACVPVPGCVCAYVCARQSAVFVRTNGSGAVIVKERGDNARGEMNKEHLFSRAKCALWNTCVYVWSMELYLTVYAQDLSYNFYGCSSALTTHHINPTPQFCHTTRSRRVLGICCSAVTLTTTT